MTQSLKQRALHGIGWNFAAGFAHQGIQVIIGILIARTLDPRDFGLMGMLAIFFTLTRALADGGLGAALIQKRDSDDTDASSVFFLNLLIALLLGGVLCGIAPWVAAFYGHPILEPMMYALAAGPVFVALGRVQSALLSKKMDFRTQFRVTAVASLAAGVVGFAAALAGLGVWSLVIMSLGAELLRSGLYWVWSGWRPKLIFSWRSVKEMASFGFPLMGGSIVAVAALDLFSLVIGKLYSAADVGLFTRAKSLMRLPVANLSAAVGNVSFSAFSEIQDDLPRLQRGVRQSMRLLGFVVFPVVAFMTGAASTLIIVLLTEKWAGCIPYLRLLCVAEALFPLAVINVSVVKARGRSALMFWTIVVKQTFLMLTLAVTCRWGIEFIILGIVVSAIFSTVVNGYCSGQLIDYGTGRQLLDVLPYMLIAIVMGAVVYSIEYVPGLSPLAGLAIQIPVGAAVYLLGCWLIRSPELVEVQSILLRKLRAKIGEKHRVSGPVESPEQVAEELELYSESNLPT